MSMFDGERLTVSTLLRTYLGRVSITWLLTLVETALMTLIPLFIGFAIDGLLDGELESLSQLAMVLGALIIASVIRRIYDTRAYGTIRVDLGKELIARSGEILISSQECQVGHGTRACRFSGGAGAGLDEFGRPAGDFLRRSVSV